MQKMHRLAINVLNPKRTVSFLNVASGTDSLREGLKTLGIIQGHAVPQRFICKHPRALHVDVYFFGSDMIRRV